MSARLSNDSDGRRKALLVSLEYKKEQPCKLVPPLDTPHRDALHLKDFLINKGYLPEDIVHLADNAEDPTMIPTRDNVVIMPRRVLCYYDC